MDPLLDEILNCLGDLPRKETGGRGHRSDRAEVSEKRQERGVRSIGVVRPPDHPCLTIKSVTVF